MRRRIILWSWDFPDWVYRPVVRACCAIWGHEAYQDHCGLPEHDSCTWCLKSMPGMAKR